MSDMISFKLNGEDVQVEPGTTIRAAAEAEGIEIPTFCYDERLKPYTSCFLCVVEVEGAKGMVPACSTSVAPNMNIQTDSEKVENSRKMCLDLLLSDHAGDCIAPCEATCPSNVDIQGYIAHVANGDYEAAVKLIKEDNPLPVVCGRICPHPCESQCRRGLVDEAVAINPLKRFAAEYELKHGAFLPECKPDTGKSTVIVGGGPAGLSAAYYLRQNGHAVTILEALPELGGMVRYGIPRFRLPWGELDQEIKAIIDLGVEVKYNTRLGTDVTLSELRKDYDSVLLAIGAHKAKPMYVDNEDCEGVIGATDFLRKAVLGEEMNVGKKVAVIGGGDTAMDCARVAKRFGADVSLLYRRTQEEMPALPIEQEEAMEEHVDFMFLTAPTEVIQDENGKAKALKVIKMELGEPDSSGRRRPVPIEGSEEIIEYDLIVAAIGQEPDLSCVDGENERPEGTRWNTFTYDNKLMTTTIDGVFTAGDCAWGPETVIRAVGEGKQAAKAIDMFLQGMEITMPEEYAISRGRVEELDMADFSPRYEHKKRAFESTYEPDKRLADGGYEPINVGIAEAQALAEATRCIECGCNARFNCDLRDYSTEYGATEKRLVGDKRNYEVDTRHPLIKIEADKCITCGSCVRVCSELREVSALCLSQRGFSTKIEPNFGDALQDTPCDACGMCIDVCPTGSMAQNTGKECGPWKPEITESTCTLCVKGCGLTVESRDGRIIQVKSLEGDPVNNAVICKDGRFSYQLAGKTQKPKGELSRAKQLLSQASSLAVVVAANTPVETIYAAYALAESKQGSLYFMGGQAAAQSDKPYAKSQGKANVALLNKLGAKVWDQSSVDCLVLIRTYMDHKPTNVKTLISLSSYSMTQGADVNLAIADVMTTEGAFLNETGALGLLKTAAPANQANVAYNMIGELGSLQGFASLTEIREALALKVPELKALTAGSTSRLIETALGAEIADVQQSAKEAAFAAYLRTEGL